jgi:hypothetical protein
MRSVSLHSLCLHIDIVAKHASDKSSLAVRAGAIHAISLLLEAEEVMLHFVLCFRQMGISFMTRWNLFDLRL